MEKTMTTLTLLFLAGSLLGVIAVLKLVPLMRHFAEEGKKADFDFYSLRASTWVFRPASLPERMIPIGLKIRFYAIALLWPACALLCVAWSLSA